jgi:drug/metabolite transporter (DMT)-like permease
MSTFLLLAVAHAMGQLRGSTAQPAAMRATLTQPAVLWRSAIDALATFAYLNSLFHLPIGNATAINMASPLFLTLYAVLRWQERVSAGRWLVIGAGFVGVLLIVQPAAEGFNAWALLCLLATLLHATRDVITRDIPRAVPSVLVTLGTAASVTAIAAAWTLWQGWQPVSLRQYALLAAASVFLSVGYHLVIVAVRAGDMSVISPFRYSGLLFALVIGWVVWGDIPNLLAWAGIALLVGAGVMMLRGQR